LVYDIVPSLSLYIVRRYPHLAIGANGLTVDETLAHCCCAAVRKHLRR
jgi:hypothetical protein